MDSICIKYQMTVLHNHSISLAGTSTKQLFAQQAGRAGT
ncbi:hypothetical protein SynMVIR181_00091 [Synechococcus sp. MVIR-18-1]|nr:hypothetical protein SynMVIR181_00091 [Synechococcus sp. MVIR-18-1]